MSSWLLGASKVLLALQATETAIVGTVRDGETGGPLASAVVTLTDVGRSVVSDSLGRYGLRAVPPGPQHVTVRRIGYAPRTLHALVPRHGRLEIDVTLRPVPLPLQPVEVRPRVAVRGVDGGQSAAFPDRGISLAAVRSHPLITEPDAFVALGGGEVVLRPESPSGIHLRGGASDQTVYLLDGVPVFSPYHAAGTFSAWNPDALERLDVFSSFPSPDIPHALSGAVVGTTRPPGSERRAEGSVSTTQARATVDGPLGGRGAGYLVSIRSGFPGFIAPQQEPSYLSGEAGDLLAKLEAPALGGRLRLLGYDSENEYDAAATPEGAGVQSPDGGRNAFEWSSRSIGAEWSRRAAGLALRLQGWTASGDAAAAWNADGRAPASMVAEQRDEGMLAVVERSASTTATLAGARVQWIRTSYRVSSASGGAPPLALSARTPVTTVFVRHERPVGVRLAAHVALSAAAAAGGVYLDPQAQLRWRPSPLLALSGTYARSHQFSQSLRNPESVIGNIFPPDLFVGADVPGVPVARSDRGVLAAELRPADGMRLGAQVYWRDFAGLLLVAPRTGEPFAAGEFTTGSGVARGVSVDGAISGARYGLLASYGWQHVRLAHADSSYSPDHAAAHLVEGGLIVFPSATSSVRLGAAGALGRRATALSGGFEWEACNLLDRGCELGGTPRHVTGSLGAAKLPPYLRLDLGFRKHWHLGAGDRGAQVALFGTITNVLGRRNVLTVATDPLTGAPIEIGMRPLAPLVVGLDWRL